MKLLSYFSWLKSLSSSCLLAASGVRVGFEQSSYTVHETNSSVNICVGMSGFEIGQPIVVTVYTSTNPFALRGNGT